MSKVIYVHDNGKEEVLREGNINKFDVLFRSDYFAWKLWSREDIEIEMEKIGFVVTDEAVDVVINYGGNWHGLNDCWDVEWDLIDDVIREAMKSDGN